MRLKGSPSRSDKLSFTVGGVSHPRTHTYSRTTLCLGSRNRGSSQCSWGSSVFWALAYEAGFVLWKSWCFFGPQFLNYKILAICHHWEKKNPLTEGLCLVQCLYPKVTYKLTVHRIKWHRCAKCYLMYTIIVGNYICERGPPRCLFTHDIYFLEKSLS